MAAPPDAGGPEMELPEVVESIEVMAGGCLATAFTWFQHHGVVLSTSFSANEQLRSELLPELTRSVGPMADVVRHRIR